MLVSEYREKNFNKRLEIVDKRVEINKLKTELQKLRDELLDEQENFIASKVAEGWQKFIFSSSYYGSHNEYGDNDVFVVYLFAPSVDLSLWADKSFTHGHYGESEDNESFELWLEQLPDDSFIEI